MDDIAHLPLVQVLDYLPVPSLLAAAQVCRRWRGILADPARWAHAREDVRRASLTAICESGTLSAVRTAHARFNVECDEVVRSLFVAASRNRDPAVPLWLADQHSIAFDRDVHLLGTNPIRQAIELGYDETAVALIEHFIPSVDSILHEFAGERSILEESCAATSRRVLEFIIERYSITLNHLRGRECAFAAAACVGGHIEWLDRRLAAAAHSLMLFTGPRELKALCTVDRGAMLRRLDEAYRFPDLWGYRLLTEAAANGALDLAKWLADRFEMHAEEFDRDPENPMYPLALACENGHIEMAEWLCERFRFGHQRACLGRTVYTVCLRGNTAMFSWLARQFDIDQYARAALKNVVQGGNVKLMKKIVEAFDIDASDIRANNCALLGNAAYWGNLDMLKYLTKEFALTVADVRLNGMSALSFACAQRNLHVAKWVADHFALTADDARRRHVTHTPLSMACSGGHGSVPVIEWLADRFGLTADDVHAHNYVALRAAASSGEAVRYLAERFYLSGEDIRHEDNYVFRAACARGDLRTAKWLARRFALTPRDAYASDGDALYRALHEGNHMVSDWLQSTFGAASEEFVSRL